MARGLPQTWLEFPRGGENMDEPSTYFITWTTYGTWLPGDARGWRRWQGGPQSARPRLEAWCRDRMTEAPLALSAGHRDKVESVIRRHAEIRGWVVHAVSVRSNHVHLVVTANTAPCIVRDQMKANATRVLRTAPDPITNEQPWTRGGDTEIIDDDDSLERVILYITEAQDRMDRGR